MAPDPNPTATTPPPLLSLPAELREHIYILALSYPRKIVTKNLPHANDTSAVQPALTLTSRQLRYETLELFYCLNTFTVQFDCADDFATARAWLRAIGPSNVGFLVRVALCGWTRVPMGHMISRRWVEVVCDLQGGKLELDGEGSGGGHPDVRGRLRALGERFQERWGRREGCKGEVLEMVLVGFYGVCAGYC